MILIYCQFPGSFVGTVDVIKWADVEGLSVIAEELEAARVRRVMGGLRRAGGVGFCQVKMTTLEASTLVIL